jgi:HSP20 family protein
MTLTKREVSTSPVARDLNRMRNRLQRFFEEPFGFDLRLPMLDEQRIERMVWSPAVEATELPTEYVITAELPGISPENVEVAMSDGMLTLKGTKLEERKEDQKDRTFHLWERSYGEFERTFRFPLDVKEDKITAEFNNGILTVKVPKMEVTTPTSRTIPIAKK